ncbi:PD40 domain-containing protein [bacterium]|nr:PD40 domain-containing protein [bacterium]
MRKVASFCLLVWGCLIIIGPGWAQTSKNKISYVDLDWRLYDTEHFNIYYYRGAENLLEEYSKVAEQAYTHHHEVLNFDLPSRIPFIMFRNQREFQQTNIILGDISEGVGGFSEILHSRMVLPVDGPREEVRRLIYHELTHIFQYEIIFHSALGQAFSNVPDWFMEGMAAHMEGAWDAFGLQVLRDAVLNESLPDLNDLHDFNYISNTFLGYRLGQSAVDYMVETYGYKGLRRLLWELSKSKTKHFREAIKRAFEITYKEFDTDWQTYLKEKFWRVGIDGTSPDTIGTLLPHEDFSIFQRGQYLQTSLSPSGDILAVLSTQRGELDINLLTADQGKYLDILTKNFQGTKYEMLLGYSDEHGRNLVWAPDGSVLACAVKKEGENVLMLLNPISGALVDEIKTNLNNLTSPTFSADTRTIVFSADDDQGQSDIYSYNRDSELIERVTFDPFVDRYPAFRPDGNALIYCSERNGFLQLVLIEPYQERIPVQLTATEYNHQAPAWSADGKKVVYIADRNLILNIYELDFENSKIRQLTNTYSGFGLPQYSPDGSKIYFETYNKSQYSTGYMDYPSTLDEKFCKDFSVPTEIVIPSIGSEEAEGAGSASDTASHDQNDLIAYLEGDQEAGPIEGKKVRFKLLPDAAEVLAGYRTDGLYYGAGYLYFSDILGDHRFLLELVTIQSDSSIGLTYYNLKHRINWAVSLSDYRDVTYYYTDASSDLEQFQFKYTGVSAYAEYPLDRYHRFSATNSFYRYKYEGYPVYNYATNNYEVLPDVTRNLYDLQLNFVRDTIRYRYFGAYQGSAVRLGVSRGLPLADDYYDFILYTYNMRAFQRVTARSLLAFRLAGAFSTGEDQMAFSLGGGTTLRGYKYNELVGNNYALFNVEYRFPLIDIIHVSFLGSFTNIRGALYWDFGTAWFDEQDLTLWEHTSEKGFHFVDLKSTQGFGIYWSLGYFELRFDWSRKYNIHEYIGDTVYQFTIGTSF